MLEKIITFYSGFLSGTKCDNFPATIKRVGERENHHTKPKTMPPRKRPSSAITPASTSLRRKEGARNRGGGAHRNVVPPDPAAAAKPNTSSIRDEFDLDTVDAKSVKRQRLRVEALRLQVEEIQLRGQLIREMENERAVTTGILMTPEMNRQEEVDADLRLLEDRKRRTALAKAKTEQIRSRIDLNAWNKVAGDDYCKHMVTLRTQSLVNEEQERFVNSHRDWGAHLKHDEVMRELSHKISERRAKEDLETLDKQTKEVGEALRRAGVHAVVNAQREKDAQENIRVRERMAVSRRQEEEPPRRRGRVEVELSERAKKVRNKANREMKVRWRRMKSDSLAEAREFLEKVCIPPTLSSRREKRTDIS